MIDGTLLEVICDIFLKKPKAEVTNQDLQALFEDRLKSDTSSLSDMPEIAHKELQFDLSLRPKARVTDLVVQFSNMTKRHNWTDAFSGTLGAKNKIRCPEAAHEALH